MVYSTKKSLMERFFDYSPIFNNKEFNKIQNDEIYLKENFLVSPVQAKLVYYGKIKSKGKIISKHGKEIKLKKLVGETDIIFSGGFYLNFYLSPIDKHYFRTPYDGRFIYTQINDSKSKFSIPIGLENLIDKFDLLNPAVKRNASIGAIFQIETPEKKFPIAIILIGSLLVNSIHLDYEQSRFYEKGTYFGRFNRGSTMLLCFPGQCNLERIIEKNKKVDIGDPIIRMNNFSKHPAQPAFSSQQHLS